MSWEKIIKGEKEYSAILDYIEKVEQQIEEVYQDIEDQAVDLHRRFGVGTVEEYRKTIKGAMAGSLGLLERTLAELRELLKDSI
jgi:Mg2+ and Co2+ transporter CorA